MAEYTVYVNKGENYDYNGRVLYQYLQDNINSNAVTLNLIEESKMYSLENACNLFSNMQCTDINLANAKFNKVLDMSYMFYNCVNLVNVVNFNTSGAINMCDMFADCNNLTTIPNIDTRNVIDMDSMFAWCRNLASVPDLNTTNVRYMDFLFYSCYNLLSAPNIDTSNATTMNFMFDRCKYLTTIPNFNTVNVKNMKSTFSNCTNLATVPNLDTINVTDMTNMFYNCLNLTSLSIINTSNVRNMTEMFSNCINLTTIPNFNTINVINMDSMFSNCHSLTTVPNFNTSNVTRMSKMFLACGNNLTTVPNFNTTKVRYMYDMFKQCYNLTTIPNFDTSNVNNMYQMFYECYNLTTIPNFNTNKVRNMSEMFYKARVNTNYNIDCSSASNIANMFGSSDAGLANIVNLGALVNLGANFSGDINAPSCTLDLYSIGTTDIANRALTSVANLSALNKNSQQIILQSEIYYGMNSSLRSELYSKGWEVVAAGNVCLTGDTLIKTKNGYKQIKDITIDDEIYTFDIYTNTYILEKVTKVINHNNLQIYKIITANSEIKCTAIHEILIKTDNGVEYKQARLISRDDVLIASEGEIKIEDIDIYDEEQLVYEINTDSNNNYLVGEDNIIVKQEQIK